MPRILRHQGENVARLTPITTNRKRTSHVRPVTEDDPHFRLTGTGETGTPGRISGKKHKALTKAYRSREF